MTTAGVKLLISLHSYGSLKGDFNWFEPKGELIVTLVKAPFK